MPTIPQSELPIPKSWDEFEAIVWDVYSRVWGDPNAQRYGRTGQAQQGVDIYGRPARLGGGYAGVQCKRYPDGGLTRRVVEEEIAKAEGFSPALAEYVIATTAHRDAKLQAAMREIDEERQAAAKFPVRVVFWEDLCSLLADPDNRDLLRKHYGDWLGRLREVAEAEVAAYVLSTPPGSEVGALPEGMPRQLKVFLCHASGDKPAVRKLYHRLRGAGFDPWLDEEKLLPGQEWQLEIPKAVRSSDVVVICLSRRAVTKAGYVQKEIRYALDLADEQPEGTIFLIPLRLEECDVPQRLRRWQWEDLFHEEGYERLLSALRARAKSLGLDRHPFEPEMVLIRAGEFLMGSDPAKDEDAEDDEQPQHTLHLPDYFLARTPITNAQYAAFVEVTGYETPDLWNAGKPPSGRENHPVELVSWPDAVAYCRWLAEVTGRAYCLPSEAEWEKGARGTDGRIYPWGDEWYPKFCNAMEWGTMPVGAYPQGASPHDLLDMVGNVWEWTRSLYWDYPYDPEDGREDPDADGLRVLRGGAFFAEYEAARVVHCAYRLGDVPDLRGIGIGFRVCVVARQG
jgi:formylglycine-generating enzyme required for sulfatase activity